MSHPNGHLSKTEEYIVTVFKQRLLRVAGESAEGTRE